MDQPNLNTNLTQPTKKEVTFTSKDIKKKSTLPKILAAVLLIVLGVVLLGLGYMFFIRVNKHIEKNDIISEVVDNTITDEHAEVKNLEQVETNEKEVEVLNTDSIVKSEVQPYKDTDTYSRLSLEIDQSGALTNVLIQPGETKNYNEIIFIDTETIKNLQVETSDIAENIADYVTTNGITNFALDVSLTNIPNYMNILEEVALGIDKSFNLSVYLYPKWGDKVDYDHYATITNSFHQGMNLAEISLLVDQINVLSYDFTGPLDILPGPVTPIWWFERIIQYYIKSGVDRDKLNMGINTEAYEWPEREFAVDPLTNYSVLATEAEAIARSTFLEFVEDNELEPERVYGISEDVYTYQKESVDYIGIIPADLDITVLERIAALYGIKGIFYK